MTYLVQINLHGRLRVTGSDGENLTPKSNKGQALIALLATQPRMERGRSWLQDKLWSDRGQDTGAASLRQELTQIRKVLGKFAKVLMADRLKVSLVQSLVKVVEPTSDCKGEFLEGIDVRDQEFSNWLSLERTARQEYYAQKTQNQNCTRNSIKQLKRSVVFVSDTSAPIELRLYEKNFSDGVARFLRELTDVSFHTHTPDTLELGQIVVSTRIFQQNCSSAVLNVSIEDFGQSGVLFGETLHGIDVSIPIDENLSCLNLIGKVSDNIISHLVNGVTNYTEESDANVLINLALRKIFSIDKTELDQADTLLELGSEVHQRGIFDALRAQLLTIQFVEQFYDNYHELRERCEAHCASALAADPTNSNVLAAVSNARTIISKNPVSGGELAILGVKSNPGNPLAWWSLSNARQYAGEYENAHEAAKRAHKLALGTRIEFWTSFQRSLTASITSRHAEALKLGEVSSALSPNFKPPLRYLTAVYAQNEQRDGATRTSKMLEKIENNFSIDKMIKDPEYPVSIMRKSGLLDQDKLREFTS